MNGRTGARWVLLVVAGVLAVLALRHGPLWLRVVPGLVVLFLAGEVGERLGPWLGGLVALPGALWVVANAAPRWHQRWSVLLLGVVVAAAVVASGRVRRLVPVPGGPWMLGLMTAGGVYACVPETGHVQEVALAVGVAMVAELVAQVRPTAPAASAAPAAPAARAPQAAQAGQAGLHGVMVGLLGWAVMYGGTYRDSAVIGGAACFGVLVLAPVVALVPAGAWGRPRGAWLRAAAIVGLQAAAALVVSRTAGLAPTWGRAVVLAVPTLVVLVALASVAGERRSTLP